MDPVSQWVSCEWFDIGAMSFVRDVRMVSTDNEHKVSLQPYAAKGVYVPQDCVPRHFTLAVTGVVTGSTQVGFKRGILRTR